MFTKLTSNRAFQAVQGFTKRHETGLGYGAAGAMMAGGAIWAGNVLTSDSAKADRAQKRRQVEAFERKYPNGIFSAF